MKRPGIKLDSGDVSFLTLVLAAFFSALFGARQPLEPAAITGLVVTGALYFILGAFYSAKVEQAHSLPLSISYIALQFPLLAIFIVLSNGFGAIIILPLAGLSIILLGLPGAIVVGALQLAMFSLIIWLLGADWNAIFQGAISLLAGQVFVMVLMLVASRLEIARRDTQSLANELQAANLKLSEYAAQAEELATTRERNRLAREIHDSLGHYLTVINVQLEAARTVFEQDPRRALDAITKAQALARDGLAEVRRSVAALRSTPLQGRSLPEAVGLLVEECRAAGLISRLDIVGSPRPLEPEPELALYRAAQEGLTNVRKHACASRVDIMMDYRPHSVKLAVRDNGAGNQGGPGGFGLLGLRERVQNLRGKVQAGTGPEGGFVLEVEMPA